MAFTPLQQNKASGSPSSKFTPIGAVSGPTGSSGSDTPGTMANNPGDVGFVQGMVRGFVSPIARSYATVRNVVENIPNVFKGSDEPPLKGETIEQYTKRTQPELDATTDKPVNLGGYLGSFKPLGQTNQTAGQQLKDAAGVGIGGAVNYLDFGVPGAVKSAGEQVVKGAVVQGAKTVAKEGAIVGAGSALSEALQNNKGLGDTLLDTALGGIVGTVVGGITGGATGGVGAAIKPIREEFMQKTNKFFDDKVTGKITDLYNKAFPAFKKDLQQGADKYAKNMVNGVRTIVESLPKDPETGMTMIPKNRSDAFAALRNAKTKMYDAYSKLASNGNGKQEVESGITDGVVKIIDEFMGKTKGTNLLPETTGHIASRMKWLNGISDLSPSGIQQAMEQLNEGAGSAFATGAESKKGAVDLQLSLKLRDMLDNVLEKTEGPGYKELRQKFASLKGIEKNFESANLKYVNKVGGKLGDQLVDPVAYGEMLAGAMTMNPAAIAKGVLTKGAKEVAKYLNSPDRAVSGMFSGVDDIYNRAARELGQYGGREASAVPEASVKDKAIKGIANVIKGAKAKITGPTK